VSPASSALKSVAGRKKSRARSGDSNRLTVYLALSGQHVALHFPGEIESDVRLLLPRGLATPAAPHSSVTIDKQISGDFAIRKNGETVASNLARAQLPIWLAEEVTEALITDQEDALVLHAAAVGWNGRAIVLPALSGAGKSSLAAWLVDKGFDYLSDEIALLTTDGGITGFRRAIVIKNGAADAVRGLSLFDDVPVAQFGEHLFLAPAETHHPESARPCGMLVFPQFRAGADLRMRTLTAADAGLRLVECNLNARNHPDGGFAEISKIARGVPAISLEYGSFDQLEETLDAVLRIGIEKQFTATELRRFTAGFSSAGPAQPVPAPAKTYPVQPATPRKEHTPKLTIGMATYDDYDGVYFSIQALRLYHPEILEDIELVVIDNRPDGPSAEALKQLEGAAPNYRYVPNNTRRGTTVKDFVFEEGAGEFVLCMDSHVFVVPGALKRLLDYFETNRQTVDLLHGPLIYDDLKRLSTHFSPVWRGGMFGIWDCDRRGEDAEAPPFEIPMQGMGLFACRREAWPGFNPRFRGFGGEEGYIHEKFRQRGGKALCLPFLRWMHRFNRPLGIPYLNTWEDRIRNYMIGFGELGLDTGQIEEHFKEFLGEETAQRILTHVREELEI